MDHSSSTTMPHAHSRVGKDGGFEWEDLYTGCQSRECNGLSPTCSDCGHLDRVSHATRAFVSEMFARGSYDTKSAGEWGYLMGIWHDLGKFAPEWQRYLQGKVDPHADEILGKVDHSSAGAQYAVEKHLLGHLLGYPIAGHHSGLLDGTSNGACQADRLRKEVPSYREAVPPELQDIKIPELPSFLKSGDAFSLGFFVRMLFSCLVDADFLTTEAFMDEKRASIRNDVPDGILESISGLIDARIDGFGMPDTADTVNTQRRAVVDDCRGAAAEQPGLFTLTVPTGGGKTLSSMSFALRHAIANGQQRIIYVAPFNSIIEQNAAVLRGILKPLESEFFTPLIEHHSSLSPENETAQSRLASENWDAPIVVTTAVQFYESLFASKTSRSRKIHNIANAVVILDEAQSLPVDLISPCLRVIQELADHYNTSIVLCTATQPAVHHHPEEFPIGLKGAREIIADPEGLFDALKRVEVTSLEDLTDTALVDRLRSQEQVLCIVNRRRHAQELYRLLGTGEGNYHLSALMCPEHRHRILCEIRRRLEKGLPARVISTQLIEAGVDIDFPLVYRALAGLDSVAQAAGRCNRHGKLPESGHTYVFRPEDQSGEVYFRETAQVANQLIGLHDDLIGRESIRNYFDLYYYQQKSRWDSEGILNGFRIDRGNRDFPFHFSYATVAGKFRLIDDWQVPVIIPYDEVARKAIAELRSKNITLHRALLRRLQRYTVQISPRLRDDNIRSFESLRDGQFHALVSTDLNYSEDFGLTFDESHASSQSLIL
jgi:CRISPR-associated endonuclease/helicase Cas3